MKMNILRHFILEFIFVLYQELDWDKTCETGHVKEADDLDTGNFPRRIHYFKYPDSINLLLKHFKSNTYKLFAINKCKTHGIAIKNLHHILSLLAKKGSLQFITT